MSVISLEERITTDMVEFEKLKKSDQSRIFCLADKIEPFSIVLTLGDQWAANISRSDPVMYAIEDDEIEIPSLSSVVVEVEETLILPFNIYGIIIQKGAAFLEEGLILAAGKIDPSFSGKLQVLIFNTTKSSRILKRGESIGNVLFFRTDRTINNSLFTSEQQARVKKRTRSEKIKSFFVRDPKFTINLIVTALTSSLVAAILTLALTNNFPSGGENDHPNKNEQKQEPVN